jgi:hypothetical protein
MEFLFSALGMILIMGMFISFVVILGTLQAEDEAERRKSIRAQERQNRGESSGEEKQIS